MTKTATLSNQQKIERIKKERDRYLKTVYAGMVKDAKANGNMDAAAGLTMQAWMRQNSAKAM